MHTPSPNPANGLGPTDAIRRPYRRILRSGLQTLLALVACTFVGLWTVQNILNELSPVRDAARRVKNGVDPDRHDAIETLIQATGEDIEVALPALITLEASGETDNRSELLTGMTHLLIQRVWIKVGSAPSAPETISRHARSVFQALQAASKSPDDETRTAAARLLCTTLENEGILVLLVPRNGNTGPVEIDTLSSALETATTDSLVEVRRKSVEALGHLAAALERDPPPALRRAFHDPSPLVRNAAAASVAGFKKGIDPYLPDLFQIIASDHSEGYNLLTDVRYRCYRAIWDTKTKPTAGAVPILASALGSPDGGVRTVAAMLLGNIGPEAGEAVPALVAALRHSLQPVPGNDPRSRDPREADAIAEALRKIDPRGSAVQREVLAFLVHMYVLDDPLATSALEALGPVAEPAVPEIIEILGNKGQSFKRRERAALTLVRIGKGTASADRARTAVEEALKNGMIRRDETRWLDSWLKSLNSP